MLRIALVALVLGLTPAALAQDTEEARRHFETGTQAFDTGDYELAVTEFQAAYAITHHADILFNIYSAAERAGSLQVAANALEQHLAEAEIEPARRPALEQRLARLRQRIAAGETQPPDEPVEGGPETPEVHDESIPEPAPAPTSGVHPAAVGLLVTAGVLLVSFGVFAGLSEMEDGNLRSSCSPGCSEGEASALTAFNVVADVSWIAAAALGVTGVILLFALPPERGAAPQAVVSPWMSPDGAGLAAVGRF